ncbi:MAG: magnesium/cobalt transporter CorA [Anaerolineales bacterium]|nr:magnesium/cobalt transporter CorA [Anaerolineales bacterium]
MIRTLYRNAKGSFTTDVPTTHWRVALADAEGLFWVDLSGEPPEKVEPLLREIFKFHPLAIDDALNEVHVPKINNWGDYIYAVCHGINYNAEKIELELLEVDAFLGENFLVTHHTAPVDFVDRLWSNCNTDQRRLARGADFLLYDMLDMLAATYLPVIDSIDDAIDHLEDETFRRPSTHTLNTLFSVKRVGLAMRRVISPLREVLNRLARDEYSVIDPKDRIYFRDVYDQFVRLADINESLRDLLSGALDTYLSVTSNRTNEIMKVLTILSALFMPMTVITGFFGMNFTTIPFEQPWLLIAALVAMVGVPVTMLLYFRQRRWF